MDAAGKTIQTIYITSGYRWCQNTKTITLYLRIAGANEIDENNYTLDVKIRSIYIAINNHRGVNYSFKIGKLCGQLEPQGTKIKFQKDNVVITLQKKEYGKHWSDIKEKRIHEVYSQLERKLYYGDSQDLSHTVGEKSRFISKDLHGSLLNEYSEQNLQELAKKSFRNSDHSTCQAVANLLSNQQRLPPDFDYSLDPFHISDIIPSTSSHCPYSHSQSHDNDKKSWR